MTTWSFSVTVLHAILSFEVAVGICVLIYVAKSPPGGHWGNFQIFTL